MLASQPQVSHPAFARHAEPLRVLIVSYSFPPVGGAGVQRTVKLCKYLPQHGVWPTVLTVSNPSAPLRDESLLGDVPDGMQIVRAHTFEPGYGFKQAAWSASAGGERPQGALARAKGAAVALAKQLLVPDPQILWQPAAQAALVRRLYSGVDDVVLISGPPFSQFLLAPTAHLRPNTGVVLDYRDEWSTTRSSYEMGSSLGAKSGELLEAAMLRFAHQVTTATEPFATELARRFDSVAPSRVTAIPNGYDPDDFPSSLPAPPQDRFVLTYAGTVFRLTSPRGLLGAIRRLRQNHPELAKLLHVRFIGRIVDTELQAFEGLDVERLGYLPHSEVLAELSASHMVLCLLDEVAGTERIYPGKIFELMYLRRPVFTLAPRGALSSLAERHALGPVAHPRDEAAIEATLVDQLRAFRDGRYDHRATPRDIERFHRREQARRFAEVLREARQRASR